MDLVFSDHRLRPELIPVLEEWYRSEWPTSFELRRGATDVRKKAFALDGAPLPLSIVGFHGDVLAGLVTLVYHAPSAGIGRPHWIDAVIVPKAYRRKGLAGALIREAERRMRLLGFKRLFALTELPSLYEKQNWQVAQKIETQKGFDFVLSKDL